MSDERRAALRRRGDGGQRRHQMVACAECQRGDGKRRGVGAQHGVGQIERGDELADRTRGIVDLGPTFVGHAEGIAKDLRKFGALQITGRDHAVPIAGGRKGQGKNEDDSSGKSGDTSQHCATIPESGPLTTAGRIEPERSRGRPRNPPRVFRSETPFVRAPTNSA